MHLEAKLSVAAWLLLHACERYSAEALTGIRSRCAFVRQVPTSKKEREPEPGTRSREPEAEPEESYKNAT